MHCIFYRNVCSQLFQNHNYALNIVIAIAYLNINISIFNGHFVALNLQLFCYQLSNLYSALIHKMISDQSHTHTLFAPVVAYMAPTNVRTHTVAVIDCDMSSEFTCLVMIGQATLS